MPFSDYCMIAIAIDLSSQELNVILNEDRVSNEIPGQTFWN